MSEAGLSAETDALARLRRDANLAAGTYSPLTISAADVLLVATKLNRLDRERQMLAQIAARMDDWDRAGGVWTNAAAEVRNLLKPSPDLTSPPVSSTPEEGSRG